MAMLASGLSSSKQAAQWDNLTGPGPDETLLAR
jgi:hypothetical protein